MEEENKDIEFEINQQQDDSGVTSDDKSTENNQDKKRKIRVSDIFAGRMLGSNKVIKQLPLALLVLLYSYILISNRYKIENLTVENKQLQHELDELRVKQIQGRCDYLNSTLFTEITEMLRPTGIKEGTTPSLKITIK